MSTSAASLPSRSLATERAILALIRQGHPSLSHETLAPAMARAILVYRTGESATAAVLAADSLLGGRRPHSATSVPTPPEPPPPPRTRHGRDRSQEQARRLAAVARTVRHHARRLHLPAGIARQALAQAKEAWARGRSPAWALSVALSALEG